MAGHPDFNTATTGNDRGIVTSTLGTDGKPVYSSATAHPTVTSAASFHQWFRNDSTVNRSEPLSLTLTRVGSTGTTYQYVSTEFFPGDGRLLNQQTNSPSHNYHFTTEFHATFTYERANADTCLSLAATTSSSTSTTSSPSTWAACIPRSREE